MQLHYDDDFVEAVVFLCAAHQMGSVPPQQSARFHREREKLYSILDPEERNSRFFSLHLEWFREWGCEKQFTGRLEHFPILRKHLNILAFRQAKGRNDEGAELYINESGSKTGVLSLRPEALKNPARADAFLCHEFSHLSDMLDPAFGYSRELKLPATVMSRHRLAQERYRVLWDVSIDGRLGRAARPTIATREQRWSEFCRAFQFLPEHQQQEIFDSVWNDPTPTHQHLETLVTDPRQLQSSDQPEPGGLCPLCGFPTFAWTDPALLRGGVASAILHEFPGWLVERGACRRCFEIYRHRASQDAIAV
jgi:hypothetical protein